MLSIVTPTLNAERFIAQNIKSIRNLPFPMEHIIVDGGSTDRTLDIINNFSECCLLHQRDNKGMYSAIDQGFNQANGEYFCYVNADDKVVPKGYKKMYNTLKKGLYDLVYSDGHFYWQDEDRLEKVKGRRFGKYHLKNGLLPFLQPSSIYTKAIYEKAGRLNYEKFKICGDLDLFQRFAMIDDSRFMYLHVNSSIFLKYGDSLGDRNVGLYQKEKKYIARDNSSKILNKFLFKLS